MNNKFGGFAKILEEIKAEYEKALLEEQLKEQKKQASKKPSKTSFEDVVQGLNKGFQNYNQEKNTSNQRKKKVVVDKNRNLNKFKNAKSLRERTSSMEEKRLLMLGNQEQLEQAKQVYQEEEYKPLVKDSFSPKEDIELNLEHEVKHLKQKNDYINELVASLKSKDGLNKAREAFILSEIFNPRRR